MRKLILILFLVSVFVSGCSKSFDGLIVGKESSDYSVDARLDSGEIRTVYLTKEQFYSGRFEVGIKIGFSCIAYNCSPE